MNNTTEYNNPQTNYQMNKDCTNTKQDYQLKQNCANEIFLFNEYKEGTMNLLIKKNLIKS